MKLCNIIYGRIPVYCSTLVIHFATNKNEFNIIAGDQFGGNRQRVSDNIERFDLPDIRYQKGDGRTTINKNDIPRRNKFRGNSTDIIFILLTSVPLKPQH